MSSQASSAKIRLQTTDKQVFEQTFVDDDYALPVNAQPRLIIDGGANVGYGSIYLTNRYPDADIVAVEPSNFEVLCENIKGYPKIHSLKAAIWKERGPLVVDSPLGSWDSSVFEARLDEMPTNSPVLSRTRPRLTISFSVHNTTR